VVSVSVAVFLLGNQVIDIILINGISSFHLRINHRRHHHELCNVMINCLSINPLCAAGLFFSAPVVQDLLPNWSEF
jgi:hypothetical protein